MNISFREWIVRACSLAVTASLAASTPVAAQDEITGFARNVTTHVVLHEVGHAALRDFNIPILANEESLADSFATIYISQNLRDEALDIILDRARSWHVENSEVKPEGYDFKGEHDLDVGRAYQVTCWLYGADPDEWEEARQWAGFSPGDSRDCVDAATDQTNGSARALNPFVLPNDMASTNVDVIYGEGPMKERSDRAPC